MSSSRNERSIAYFVQPGLAVLPSTYTLQAIQESPLAVTIPSIIRPLKLNLVRRLLTNNLHLPPVDMRKSEPVSSVPSKSSRNKGQCREERDTIVGAEFGSVQLRADHTSEVSEAVYAEDQRPLAGFYVEVSLRGVFA